jgi:hypothetical protein
MNDKWNIEIKTEFDSKKANQLQEYIFFNLTNNSNKLDNK